MSWVFDHSSRCSRPSRESRNNEGEFFGNGKCELQRHNGETGSVKGETKVRFFGKGKCELTAIVRIFGMGKYNLIANFSATMMTSLPSISLSLSLSLSVSLSLSHRAYLAHNIGSASALPIIHTGGEQIQGNETRNIRDWGPRPGENRGGRVGKLDSTSSLRLDKDPR